MSIVMILRNLSQPKTNCDEKSLDARKITKGGGGRASEYPGFFRA